MSILELILELIFSFMHNSNLLGIVLNRFIESTDKQYININIY